MQALIDLRK